MPVCPKAVQLLWSEQRKKNKKTGFLSTQCTIQGQSGSPQESHLISSSLHVINLPAQCYCSAGHSSSFRGRGIDQAGTASVLHLCVSWANGKKNEQNCPEHTTHPVFVPLYVHARVRIFSCKRLCASACLRIDVGWYSWPYSVLIVNTSLLIHSCLASHVKKTGTEDGHCIVNERRMQTCKKREMPKTTLRWVPSFLETSS